MRHILFALLVLSCATEEAADDEPAFESFIGTWIDSGQVGPVINCLGKVGDMDGDLVAVNQLGEVNFDSYANTLAGCNGVMTSWFSTFGKIASVSADSTEPTFSSVHVTVDRAFMVPYTDALAATWNSEAKCGKTDWVKDGDVTWTASNPGVNGTTCFPPSVDLYLKREGDLLIFTTVDPAQTAEHETLHAQTSP